MNFLNFTTLPSSHTMALETYVNIFWDEVQQFLKDSDFTDYTSSQALELFSKITKHLHNLNHPSSLNSIPEEVVQLLLEPSKNFFLHALSYHNQYDLLKIFLLDERIDPNKPANKGATPLHLACQSNHFQIVQLLINNPRIDINKLDDFDSTPLQIACHNPSMDPLVKITYQDDPNVDPILTTPFLKIGYTSRQFSQEQKIIRLLLLDPRIDVNKSNKNGNFPLIIACAKKVIPTAKLLLSDPKIDVTQKNTDGLSALHIACINDLNDVIPYFINSPKIDLNDPDRQGKTPLFLACMSPEIEIARMLLKDSRIDPNKAEIHGYTPLHNACALKLSTTVQLLLTHPKIDINKLDNQRNTPLHIACKQNLTDIVASLFCAMTFSF